jgi:hypothetical protein
MGIEIIDIKTKEEKRLNFNTWTYINKITLGLFPKMGINYPICYEDCKIIARIIRNYNIYVKHTSICTKKPYNIEELSDSEISYLEELANFYENAIEGIDRDD